MNCFVQYACDAGVVEDVTPSGVKVKSQMKVKVRADVAMSRVKRRLRSGLMWQGGLIWTRSHQSEISVTSGSENTSVISVVLSRPFRLGSLHLGFHLYVFWELLSYMTY